MERGAMVFATAPHFQDQIVFEPEWGA